MLTAAFAILISHLKEKKSSEYTLEILPWILELLNVEANRWDYFLCLRLHPHTHTHTHTHTDTNTQKKQTSNGKSMSTRKRNEEKKYDYGLYLTNMFPLFWEWA